MDFFRFGGFQVKDLSIVGFQRDFRNRRSVCFCRKSAVNFEMVHWRRKLSRRES